jgi:RNA polymerase sigma factor (sigma-70 family)
MRDAPDAGLLEQFVQSESEAAFAALVERHINLVYSTALRHTANPHHAQEITQAVFIILARKARTLPRRIVLSGWLYHTARLTAANFQRAEWRRIRREQEAYMQSTLEDHPMETAWRELSPLLDEAMARLGPTDRDALVLRYFENKSLREVGDALGLQERAAQKRVLRGLEKLRTFFARRGVALTTAIIAGAVSANSVQAAPVGLAATISATAAKGSAVAASTLTLVKGALKIMAWTKAKTAVVVAAGVILTAGTTAVVVKAVHSAQEKAYDGSRAADLFKTFVAEKRAQVAATAAVEGKQMPAEYNAFFAAAEKGNLPAMLRIFNGLESRAPLSETSFEAAKETYYSFEMFSMWDEKYALAYARGIIESIPPGSIYFTGVPMGAYLIPALQKSEGSADPCFTLDQGTLVDESYRTYLRNMYDGKMYIPTEEDVQKCFQDYAPDALQRHRQHKLQREDFQRIDRLIARVIFEKNPDHEFYFEEAWPVEWMYPHLEPHGLILKLNRQPVSELSDDMVAQDHDFWVKQLQPMIGDWLTYGTPVEELATWTERVRLKHDFNGFTGDRRFVEGISGERQIFSKLRNAIGGVYAWRADHATNPAEKERMIREADFAFRQALALWPCSSESCSPVFRYMALLKKENRQSDAGLVQAMAQKCSKQLK